MDQSTFDAKGFIEFDLEMGSIYSAGGQQLALVPLDALAALEPKEQLTSAASSWGRQHGEKFRKHISDSGASAGIEVLADHLGGTAAALGMGRLSLEIVGDALLFRSKSMESAGGDSAFSALMSGFLKGFLNGFAENSFDVASLGADRSDLVFIAGNSAAVDRVRRWRQEGMELLAAVGRLSEGRA